MVYADLLHGPFNSSIEELQLQESDHIRKPHLPQYETALFLSQNKLCAHMFCLFVRENWVFVNCCAISISICPQYQSSDCLKLRFWYAADLHCNDGWKVGPIVRSGSSFRKEDLAGSAFQECLSAKIGEVSRTCLDPDALYKSDLAQLFGVNPGRGIPAMILFRKKKKERRWSSSYFYA